MAFRLFASLLEEHAGYFIAMFYNRDLFAGFHGRINDLVAKVKLAPVEVTDYFFGPEADTMAFRIPLITKSIYADRLLKGLHSLNVKVFRVVPIPLNYRSPANQTEHLDIIVESALIAGAQIVRVDGVNLIAYVPVLTSDAYFRNEAAKRFIWHFERSESFPFTVPGAETAEIWAAPEDDLALEWDTSLMLEDLHVAFLDAANMPNFVDKPLIVTSVVYESSSNQIAVFGIDARSYTYRFTSTKDLFKQLDLSFIRTGDLLIVININENRIPAELATHLGRNWHHVQADNIPEIWKIAKEILLA